MLFNCVCDVDGGGGACQICTASDTTRPFSARRVYIPRALFWLCKADILAGGGECTLFKAPTAVCFQLNRANEGTIFQGLDQL
jgi:hypothetical protein